jgi:hypothetical protein
MALEAWLEAPGLLDAVVFNSVQFAWAWSVQQVGADTASDPDCRTLAL